MKFVSQPVSRGWPNLVYVLGAWKEITWISGRYVRSCVYEMK